MHVMGDKPGRQCDAIERKVIALHCHPVFIGEELLRHNLMMIKLISGSEGLNLAERNLIFIIFFAAIIELSDNLFNSQHDQLMVWS